MFGESDEVFRIKDGSTALIKALLAALQNKVEMRLGQALAALDVKDGRIVASFDAQGGTTLGDLRCRDPGPAIHPSAAGQGFGEPWAWRTKS